MALLNSFLAHLSPLEGFYANTAGDLGGETYRGIARNSHPTWAGWKIIDAEKARKGGRLPHNHRINDLTLDNLIVVFYRDKFWNKLNGDKINSQMVANAYIDHYVNAPATAVAIMQNILKHTFKKEIAIDNIHGPQTLAAINSVPEKDLAGAYAKGRKIYYNYRAGKLAPSDPWYTFFLNLRVYPKPDQEKFLNSWLRRLQGFPEFLEDLFTAIKKKSEIGTALAVIGIAGASVFVLRKIANR